MINATSRYTQTSVTRDGTSVAIAVKGEKYLAKRTMFIITAEGDTFDKIAGRIFGDSTLWWKIAGLNPAIRFPDSIPVGTVLVVPVS